MDAPEVDADMLRRSLAFIRRVNMLLGYTRATLSHLERFSRNWKPGETIRILDFATGSADIPRAIVQRGRKHGFDIRVVGIDLQATTARQARDLCADEANIEIVRANVLEVPFADQSFDYAITAMFLHHLPNEQVIRVLRNMNRVARRGIIVADLLRRYRAYAWISLFTLFSNPMVKHDARVSVAQAFSEREVLHLRDVAGIGFARYSQHFGHRFVLAGEKSAVTI